MKMARFEYQGRVYQGELEGERLRTREEEFPLQEVELLTPSLPSKIVCVGLNYTTHAQELGMPLPEEPILFLKPPSSALRHRGTVLYPGQSSRVHYEGEVGVVMGRKSRGVGPEEAKDSILGYTCFNDITARDLQERDRQWTRAKSFDTFAPFGPVVETEAGGEIEVSLYLNGERRQKGSTGELIFPIEELVSFISNIMTLLPGDVIATGTPPGVGELLPGDEVEVDVSGVGKLTNYVGREE